MLDSFTFPYRVAFLAGLMAVAALADLCLHGRAATRYQEYTFISVTGLLGCVVGAATDLITSSISPDYFTLGKGLSGGEGFAPRVAVFGIKQGLSGGVIAGALCVYASRCKTKFPPLALRELLGLLWMPVVCALAGALLFPLVAGHSDPAALALKMDGLVSAAQVPPFLRVWWIHTGLYSGLLAGVIWLIVVVLKRRRAREEAGKR
ncbi:MAG: hypothetical protein ABSA47_16305 [Verrucomicrobiota bacterium]|jgi:hypothetical protein